MKATNDLMLYARKKHLVERFRYWTEVRRRRHDDVIQILMYKECFYSEFTINLIIKTWEEDTHMEKQLREAMNILNL